jgi:Predicted integral membrane protein
LSDRAHYHDEVLIAIIGLNLMALAVFLYGFDGTYVIIGTYGREPVFYYVPTRLSVVVSLVVLLAGLSLLLSSRTLARSPRWPKPVAAALAVLTLVVGLAASQTMGSVKVQVMGGVEDSYVIQLEAARLLLRGLDPYSVNYSSFLMYGAPATKLTFIYSAGPPYSISHAVGFVSVLDYPAFSFIYYLPAVLLRLPGNVWDSIVLGAALVVAFTRAKGGSRWLLLPLLASGLLYFITDPTVFDPLAGWLAPLVLAVSFAENPVVAGALLGLATSYRQYALAAALVYFPLAYRRGYRKVPLGIASMIAVIGVLNAPFFFLTGQSFMRYVVAPVAWRLDIEGLGLASVYFLTDRAVPRLYLMAAAASVALMTPALTYRLYRQLGGLSYALPSIAFLLYPRPLYSYWLWFPFIGIMDLILNELNDDLVVSEAQFRVLAVSPLVAISGLLAALASTGGLQEAIMLAAAGLGLALSTAVVLLFRPGKAFSSLVGASVLAGLAASALSANLYARSPRVVVTLPLLQRVLQVVRAGPRPYDLYLGVASSGLLSAMETHLILPYGSLPFQPVNTMIKSLPQLSPSASQLWAALALAVPLLVIAIYGVSGLDLLLFSEALGVIVFAGPSLAGGLALAVLLSSVTLTRGPKEAASALRGIAASLSLVGLLGLLSAPEAWRRRTAIIAMICLAMTLAVLRGGYLLAYVTEAARYLFTYGSLAEVKLGALLVAAALGFPLLALRARKLSLLRGWALASPLVSLSALVALGLTSGDYYLGYVIFTLATALEVAREHQGQVNNPYSIESRGGPGEVGGADGAHGNYDL